MSKINKIPSEIRKFFTEKAETAQWNTLQKKALKEFCMHSKELGGNKRENWPEFSNFHLLLPCFT